MLIIGILLGLIGISLTGFGVYSFRRRRLQNAEYHSTIGEVTQVIKRINSKGKKLYYPSVRFQTANGNVFSFESDVGSQPSAHKVGQRVSVLYNPRNPQQAFINSFLSLWLRNLIFIFVGVVFVLVGVALSFFGAVFGLFER